MIGAAVRPLSRDERRRGHLPDADRRVDALLDEVVEARVEVELEREARMQRSQLEQPRHHDLVGKGTRRRDAKQSARRVCSVLDHLLSAFELVHQGGDAARVRLASVAAVVPLALAFGYGDDDDRSRRSRARTVRIALPGANPYPEGILETESGRLFVTGFGDGSIYRVDPPRRTVETFKSPGEDGLSSAVGLAIDEARGRLWVANFSFATFSSELVVFDVHTRAPPDGLHRRSERL